MDLQRLWILLGICLGAGAGIMGAYVGWRQASGIPSRRFMITSAVLTLIFAIGLGTVALAVKTTWEFHVLLLLPSALLGYWFLRQVLSIRAAGSLRSADSDLSCKE
jgi:hypothetical protein